VSGPPVSGSGEVGQGNTISGQGLTLSQIGQSSTLTSANYQDPKEAEHKRAEEAAQAAHRRKLEEEEKKYEREQTISAESYRRWKEAALFVLIVSSFIACVVIMFRGGSSTEAQSWARSTLALIIGAAVGYITGQASKS
jgi:cation transport ATPase